MIVFSFYLREEDALSKKYYAKQVSIRFLLIYKKKTVYFEEIYFFKFYWISPFFSYVQDDPLTCLPNIFVILNNRKKLKLEGFMHIM